MFHAPAAPNRTAGESAAAAPPPPTSALSPLAPSIPTSSPFSPTSTPTLPPSYTAPSPTSARTAEGLTLLRHSLSSPSDHPITSPPPPPPTLPPPKTPARRGRGKRAVEPPPPLPSGMQPVKKAKNGRPMRQPKVVPPKPGAAGGEAGANGVAGAEAGTEGATKVEGEGGEVKEGEKAEEKKDGVYNRKDKSLGLLCDKSAAVVSHSDAGPPTSPPHSVSPVPVPLPAAVGAVVLCVCVCVCVCVYVCVCCVSFLREYSNNETKQICLDASAKLLKVERRRIYDIVNILEAVAVVSRRGKNQYDWHGTALLVDRINRLSEALKESEAETGGALHTGMLEMNKSMMRADTTADIIAAETAAALPDPSGWSSDAVISNLISHNSFVFESPAAPQATPTPPAPIPSAPDSTILAPILPPIIDPAAAAAAAASKRKKPPVPTGRDVRKEQSLGNLSAVFVQMFLANETRIVSLEDAAKWLLKGSISQEGDGDGEGGEGQEGKQQAEAAGGAGGGQSPTATETKQSEAKEGKEMNVPMMGSQAGGEAKAEVKEANITLPPPPPPPPSSSLTIPPSAEVTVSVSSSNAGLFPPSALHLYPLRPPTKPKTPQARAASLFKSKVRRLYDIANVFSSLKLIDKIHLIQSRRPAFRWLGADRYPLQSTISPDAYTRETVNREPAAANKRKSSSFKQEQEEAAKRVKKEGEGGSSSAAAADDQANAAFPHTLHSSFSAPPGTVNSARPLAFSFSPSPQATTASASASSASSSPMDVQSTSTSSTSSTSASASASTRVDGGSGDERYWFLNPPHSFCIEKGQMSTFSPIDFAYLPYMRPDAVTAPPSQEPGGLPPHVEQMPHTIRASYVKDTAAFVDAYSASCGEWMERVPEYVKAHEQMLPPAPVKLMGVQPAPQSLEAATSPSEEAGGAAGMRTRRARGVKK